MVVDRRDLGHRLPRQVARVGNDIYAGLDDLERPRWEHHAVSPDRHALAVCLFSDPSDVLGGKVGVDLESRRGRSLGLRHRGHYVGIGSECLHPRDLAGRLPRRRSLWTWIRHEGFARHHGRVVDIRRHDLTDTRVTRQGSQRPRITRHIPHRRNTAVEEPVELGLGVRAIRRRAQVHVCIDEPGDDVTATEVDHDRVSGGGWA